MSAAVQRAERSIQRILLDLEAETGGHVDAVRVDTRNYANCDVEIFLIAEGWSQGRPNCAHPETIECYREDCKRLQQCARRAAA